MLSVTPERIINRARVYITAGVPDDTGTCCGMKSNLETKEASSLDAANCSEFVAVQSATLEVYCHIGGKTLFNKEYIAATKGGTANIESFCCVRYFSRNFESTYTIIVSSTIYVQQNIYLSTVNVI